MTMVIKAHDLKYLLTILVTCEGLIQYYSKAALGDYQEINENEWDDEVIARLSVIGTVVGWLSPKFKEETRHVMPWGFVRGLFCLSSVDDNPDNRAVLWALINNEIRLTADYCHVWLRALDTKGIDYNYAWDGVRKENPNGSKN